MPDRLQQEIDDLLARLDTFPPKRSLWTRVKRRIGGVPQSVSQALGGIALPRLSAGHVLLIAVGVIVIGSFILPSTGITQWVIAAAIVVFIFAFVMSLRRHARPPEKYWRDKPLDLHSGSRFRSWWDRRRKR